MAVATTASPKRRSPFADRAIAGDQNAAPLVAPGDELKEQMRRIGLERQIAELVDNQQLRLAEMGEAVLQPALAMRLGELGHQGGRWNELHRIASEDRLASDRHCQMRLADTRRPQ